MIESVSEWPPRLWDRRFPGPWQCFLSKAWLAENILSEAKAVPLPSPQPALAGKCGFFNIPLGPSRTAWLASVALLLISNWQQQLCESP